MESGWLLLLLHNMWCSLISHSTHRKSRTLTLPDPSLPWSRRVQYPPHSFFNNGLPQVSRLDLFSLTSINVRVLYVPSWGFCHHSIPALYLSSGMHGVSGGTWGVWCQPRWICVFDSLSSVRPFVTPWTIDCQAPLSREFSSQEHWSGYPFSSPGDLPNPGIKPGSSA